MVMAPHEFVGAIVVDAIVGDPPQLPHPVRAIGVMVSYAQRLAQERALMDGTAGRAAGALTALLVPAAAYVAGACVLRLAGSTGKPLRACVTVAAAASTLAWRDLVDEAGAVADALELHDLPRARTQLARIVGRDTADLDESEIARAAVETLAESTCDGIVAPLFYLAVGGVPLALAYKAVNTLDSMIGHIEPPYRDFGRYSAKLDDAANLVPARITAAAICTAAQLLYATGRSAFGVCVRDAPGHRSPNAGWPEAAMAGALRARLGGVNTYDGAPRAGATLGGEFAAPSARDVRRAMRVGSLAAALAAAAAVAFVAIRHART